MQVRGMRSQLIPECNLLLKLPFKPLLFGSARGIVIIKTQMPGMWGTFPIGQYRTNTVLHTKAHTFLWKAASEKYAWVGAAVEGQRVLPRQS